MGPEDSSGNQYSCDDVINTSNTSLLTNNLIKDNTYAEKHSNEMNGNNNNKLNKISIKTISERECSQSSAIEVCPVLEEAPYHIVLLCYLSYVILILFGYLRDFLRNTGIEKNKTAVENNREGYVSLYQSFESFYTRNIYRRICDAWNMPISSVPGARIQIVDRYTDDYNWNFRYPGTITRAINMGSYNYLGFAENEGPNVDTVQKTIHKHGIGVGTTRHEIGTISIHKELETLLAKFLGVESSVVFGMGFATNSTNIPILAGKGTLIISDEYNHASLILGCRTSGASICVFKHNDMTDLENKIREQIIRGQRKTRRPWKKIIIIVEGIYSMEGTIINLPQIIKLKKKYKCYVYLDEAHSIGAIGSRGRGVVDYFGCDPNDVDLLMGTFTKSFGAAGGYIAGKRDVINHIMIHSQSASYATSISPCIAQQIICVMNVIMGVDGTDDGQKRIERLARNARYFRKRLKQMGFILYGNDDSPVVPVIVFFVSKICAIVRLAVRKGIGTVGAGFPATSLTTGRVRFCVSASHTKEMLDKALQVMDEIGDEVGIKYSKNRPKDVNIVY